MGGARVTTLVTLRKCTLGHKREIKTLKFVSASTKGFKGGLSLDQALQERHGSDFFLLSAPHAHRTYKVLSKENQKRYCALCLEMEAGQPRASPEPPNRR